MISICLVYLFMGFYVNVKLDCVRKSFKRNITFKCYEYDYEICYFPFEIYHYEIDNFDLFVSCILF